MFFIILVFLSAFFLEGIGTVISIMGLTQLLGLNYLIISLAVAFDIAKLTIVSLVYKEWQYLPKALKFYLTVASLVLISITSVGAGGFLKLQFQKAILPSKSIEVKVNALTEEKAKLEARKKDIDTQIAQLPTDYVKGRTKLMNNFKSELDHVNSRIIQLDEELPKVQIDQMEKSSHSIPEYMMAWVIGLIIFVFDPLAVAMILGGNYLIERYHHKRKTDIIIEEVVNEDTTEQITENMEEAIHEVFTQDINAIEPTEAEAQIHVNMVEDTDIEDEITETPVILDIKPDVEKEEYFEELASEIDDILEEQPIQEVVIPEPLILELEEIEDEEKAYIEEVNSVLETLEEDSDSIVEFYSYPVEEEIVTEEVIEEPIIEEVSEVIHSSLDNVPDNGDVTFEVFNNNSNKKNIYRN